MPQFDLTVVPPNDPKKSVQFTWTPSASTVKSNWLLDLKRQVAQKVGTESDDLVLYFQNPSGPYSYRLQHIAEDSSINDLGLADKATIVCQSATIEKKQSKGVASPYYMFTDIPSNFPQELVSKPTPKADEKIEPQLLSKEKASETSGLPQRTITNYSWVDESRREVKVYVDAAGEPDVMDASYKDMVEVKFKDQGFCLTVTGDKMTYVLAVTELEHPIIPDECTMKVKLGKRITITLAKATEDTIWHTLLYRR
jgi:hypothetical protein